jgi:hypothetical protein
VRATTPKESPNRCQLELQTQLIQVLGDAFAVAKASEQALQTAQNSYLAVARILVALRHQFTTSDGETPDLQGRSAGYRRLVRAAYERVGASANEPIAKKLTAGTAYWVRRLLIEQYGERALYQMGALPRRRVVRRALERISNDPEESFTAVAGILNMLATNLAFSPNEQTMRSVTRAVALLQRRLCAHRELGAA